MFLSKKNILWFGIYQLEMSIVTLHTEVIHAIF